MEILQYQSFDKIVKYFVKDPNELIKDLQKIGFLSYLTRCDTCAERLTLKGQKNSSKIMNCTLVCRKCNSATPIIKNSFFEKLKVAFPSFSLEHWFVLFLCWSTTIKIKPVALLLNCKGNDVLRAYTCLRKVCIWKLKQHPELFQFGGEGCVVQLVEKFFPYEQKYDKRPSLYSKEWVIVMYDTDKKRGAVVYIPGLLSDKLNTIIKNHIQRGTIVQTKSNSILKNHDVFKRRGPYETEILQECSDKKSDCCIYNYWDRFIQFLESKRVMKSPRLPEYIDEFLWRDIYGETKEEAHRNLLNQIRECFPYDKVVLDKTGRN